MKNSRQFKEAHATGRRRAGGTATVPETRSWAMALTWAAAFVGGAVALSAGINPLFGRFVHWDWMAGLAPTLFVLAALALRRRWV